MDSLSAITSMGNLAAVVDNLYRGVNFLRQKAQDPRVDGLFVRLLTEKARLAEWKRRVGIEKIEDFETPISKLPEDAEVSLSMNIGRVESYVQISERLYPKNGIASSKTADKPKTFSDKWWRVSFWWMGTGNRLRKYWTH